MKLKSLIAGLLAGTVLGILFSPDKGDKIRGNIKKEVEKGGTGLGTIWDTMKKMGKEMETSAKDTYEEVSKTETFKKGAAKAKKLIKENIPAEYREEAAQALKKAKKAVSKVKGEK